MRKLLIYCSIFVLVFLAACGVKKTAVPAEAEKASEVPLHMQIVSDSADSMQKNPTLGLLWQNDSLRIVLNQGRQLRRACNTTDTLYLYETPRDSADLATRQYALSLPMHELHIIKYNDSLVYPIMPTTEPCEYPLDIKSMGVKNIIRYNDMLSGEIERQKKSGYMAGALNESLVPMELCAGTYLYNAGLYTRGTDCECIIDSSQMLILYVDGTWSRYENKILKNCGVMRKIKVQDTYEAFSYRSLVFFIDTTSVNFPEHDYLRNKRKEGVPMSSNEYSFVGKSQTYTFCVFPCREDSIMRYFFNFNNSLLYEGSSCGWQIMRN